MRQLDLSIIISCFNETQRLPRYIDEAYQFLEKNINSFELILVNDGSTDQTESLIKSYTTKYPKIKAISYPKNRGKGYGIKTGVAKAEGQVIAYMDADFAIDLQHIPQFFEKLNSDTSDIIIASRNLKGSQLSGDKSFIRRSLGITLSIINNFMLNLKGISDTQCGFKFFKDDVAKILFSKLTTFRWLFDMEILSTASQQNYSIKTIPVKWTENSGSKVNLLRDFVPVSIDLVKIYLRFALLKLMLILTLFLGLIYIIFTL